MSDSQATKDTQDRLDQAGIIVEARARWAAATIVLSYMGRQGVTSSAGDCPHCGCCLLFIHEAIPYAETGTNFWTAYECARCGATYVLGDVHPHVSDYLDKAMRPTR